MGVGMAQVGMTTGRGKRAQALNLSVKRRGRTRRWRMSAQNQARGSGLKTSPGHCRLCAGARGVVAAVPGDPRRAPRWDAGQLPGSPAAGQTQGPTRPRASEKTEPNKSDHSEAVSVERNGVGLENSVPARGTAPASARGAAGTLRALSGAGRMGRRQSRWPAGPVRLRGAQGALWSVSCTCGFTLGVIWGHGQVSRAEATCPDFV